MEAGQDERISQLEQQQNQAPPPQDQQPPAAPNAMIDQLNQLADLHQKGVLTDDEFAAAKAKVLGT